MDKKPLFSEVRAFHGMPTLFINGEPDTGLMHWNRRPEPEDIAVFRDSGIHLVSFMGTLAIRKAPDIPASYRDGLLPLPELTEDFLDRTLAMLEETDPAIKVLVRFRITPPEWWREEHPADMIRTYRIASRSFADEPHAAVSSSAWRETVREAIEKTVEYLEAEWPHRVLGYHPGLACCAENAYAWGNCIADFSAPQLAAFRKWLERGYGTVERLNASWHTELSSFDEAEFPAPEIYLAGSPADARVLLDPEKERHAVDFMRFNSEMMADAVVFQAKTVKNTLRKLGRTKICGAFYGYVNLPSSQADYFCSGHNAHKAVLEEPDIDFLCAPVGYSARQTGGVSAPQLLPASAAAHGKLYYAEEDTRFHLAKEERECVSGSEPQTASLLYRTFFDSWRAGGTIWWMDLFGRGWYRDPWFKKPLSFCAAFARGHLENRVSTAQIAVFFSDRSVAWERMTLPALSGSLVEQQIAEIASCGAPFDLFRLEDIPLLAEQGRLTQYRLVLFLNAHDVPPALRACMKEKLFRDGRTVVFFAASGIMDGKVASAENMFDLTGIRTTVAPSRNCLLTESFLEGRRIVFGWPRCTDPCIVSALPDPDAEILGWYVHGTLANEPGKTSGGSLVTKKFPSWRSVWCASPGLPEAWIAHFAREAGAHIWSACGDQVFSARDWFGFAAKSSGPHGIRLPEKCTVRDAFTEEVIARDADFLTVPANRGDFRLFLMQGE